VSRPNAKEAGRQFCARETDGWNVNASNHSREYWISVCRNWIIIAFRAGALWERRRKK
jgi:hypothetical protein